MPEVGTPRKVDMGYDILGHPDSHYNYGCRGVYHDTNEKYNSHD